MVLVAGAETWGGPPGPVNNGESPAAKEGLGVRAPRVKTGVGGPSADEVDVPAGADSIVVVAGPWGSMGPAVDADTRKRETKRMVAKGAMGAMSAGLFSA